MKKIILNLFFILIFFKYYSTGLSHSQKLYVEGVINNLLTYPLSKDNLMITIDNDINDYIDLDGILMKNHFLHPYSVTTFNQLPSFIEKSPTEFYRGSSTISFMIFYQDPSEYLDLIQDSNAWNLEYNIIMCLSDIPTDKILGHSVIQRSKYISLFELGDKNKFEVFKSRTFIDSNDGYKLKSPMPLWDLEIYREKSNLFKDRFSNFENLNLIVSSWCDDFPFIYYKDNDTCQGINLDLLDIISKNLNFTYTYQMEVEDFQWGSKENGTWNGMLGELAYKGKHLVINYFLITIDRLTDFDSSQVYYSEGFGFAIRIPPPIPRWLGILYPFTTFVWISVIVVSVLVSGFLSGILLFVKDRQDADYIFMMVSWIFFSLEIYHKV